MIEVFGWVSSIFLALCGVPQAWKCFKEKHARGISWGFILLWFAGEIVGLVYTISIGAYPLIANYSFNTLVTFVILYYKIKEKKCLT